MVQKEHLRKEKIMCFAEIVTWDTFHFLFCFVLSYKYVYIG